MICLYLFLSGIFKIKNSVLLLKNVAKYQYHKYLIGNHEKFFQAKIM